MQPDFSSRIVLVMLCAKLKIMLVNMLYQHASPQWPHFPSQVANGEKMSSQAKEKGDEVHALCCTSPWKASREVAMSYSF